MPKSKPSHHHDGQVASLGERASNAFDAAMIHDSDDLVTRWIGERFAHIFDGEIKRP